MRNRRAFTLIELLVVIGIIAILVAMATIGYGIVQKMAAGKSTRATLEVAQALVDETSIAFSGPSSSGLQLLESTNPQPPPVFLDSTTARASIACPGSGYNPEQPVDFYDSSHVARYQDPAIVTTQQIMAAMLRFPKNKQVMLSMPARDLLPAPYPPGAAPSGLDVKPHGFVLDASNNPSPPMLVDGWHNPLVFVPAGGMTGVTFQGRSGTFTVRVSGVYSEPAPAVPSGGEHPFWASAGPDGDFTKGDDNIYSFEAK